MPNKQNDPTLWLRVRAGEYAGVDEGTACAQASFKVGKKAILYVGPQGGRFKAMFKLKDSIPEAESMAQSDPERFEVGKFGWVTARFTAEEGLPAELAERWLDESYSLASGGKK